jgi:hypothetical protein
MEESKMKLIFYTLIETVEFYRIFSEQFLSDKSSFVAVFKAEHRRSEGASNNT